MRNRKRKITANELRVRSSSIIIESGGNAHGTAGVKIQGFDPWGDFDRELRGKIRSGKLRADSRTKEVKK